MSTEANKKIIDYALLDAKRKFIEAGPIKILKEFKLGGLDEALYSAFNSVLKQRKLRKLESKLEGLELDLSDADPSYKRVLDTPPNSSTFFALKRERRKLKNEIVRERRERGEKIGAVRNVLYAKDLVGQKVDSVLNFFGDSRRNIATVVSFLSCSAITAYSIDQFLESRKDHIQASSAYTRTLEGEISYDIKRGYKGGVNAAAFHILSWPEMCFEDEDGESCFPGKAPNIPGAISSLDEAIKLYHRAASKLDKSILSNEERKRIMSDMDRAQKMADKYIRRLRNVNEDETFIAEAFSLYQFGKKSDGVIEMVEKHLDPEIVDWENHAHGQKMKWGLTLSVGLLFSGDGARRSYRRLQNFKADRNYNFLRT